MANPEDLKRDQILRFLYERHKTARGMGTVALGIREIQGELKKRHGLKQQEVVSNLDYLAQVGWVREVVKERSFTTPKGTKIPAEQCKYKISEVGIDYLEGATVFKKPESSMHINVSNINGVVNIGDGNVVNAHYTDLYRALDGLDKAIGDSGELSDEQKLNAAADLTTIRSQISKPTPNACIIRAAWEGLKGLAAVVSVGKALGVVGKLILDLLN
jgi:hypothetical protein